LLSDFRKKFEVGSVSKDVMEKLRDQTNEWNSKNSLFFSAQTNLVSYQFRSVLLSLMQKKEVARSELRRLHDIAGQFELALKSDLGIYVVEFSDSMKRIKSYTELRQEVVKQPTPQT
jgi:hypothetical protein